MGATFEKLTHTEKTIYGPRKMLLCGFPAGAHPKFKTVLKMADLEDVAVVWVNEKQARETVADLMELPPETGFGHSSTLLRAIVVGGIAEKKLHALMNICRRSGMQNALWAVLTAVSESWPLGDLLNELQAEREAIKKAAAGRKPLPESSP